MSEQVGSEIPAFDEPLEFKIEHGEVVINGPDGLCASLTLEAARESSRRLASLVERLSAETGQTYQKPLG